MITGATTERGSWGALVFVAAAAATAFLYLWYAARVRAGSPPQPDGGLLTVAALAAVTVAAVGHMAYPRLHNLKVFFLSYALALVGLLYVGARGMILQGGTLVGTDGALRTVTVLSLYVLAWSALLLPGVVSYRAAVTVTVAIVGVLVAGAASVLVIPSLRAPATWLWEVGLGLDPAVPADTALAWPHALPPLLLGALAVSGIIATVLRERSGFALGAQHAGLCLFAAAGWLAPAAAPVWLDLLMVALLFFVALSTVVHWLWRIENRALYDPLLRIYNRGYCEDVLAERGMVDSAPPFAIAMFDIDHFKQFNDKHGHDAGDMVLVTVAQTIREAVVPHGVVARYGGEEIVAFFPGTDAADAAKAAERARVAVEGAVVRY